MITRRGVVIALGAGSLAPLVSFAQPQQKVYRVGTLSTSSAASSGHLFDAFAQGLRDLGYVEGKNIVIERRFAEGNIDRLPALAAELVQLKVDVILAGNTPSVQAARQVAGTLPIVFASPADPVGSGFVATLARPGGNITGASVLSPELSAKRLEILKEAFPKISRIAVFGTDEPSVALQFPQIKRAAKVLRVEVLSVELQRREDFEQTAALLRKWRADSMYVIETPLNFYHRKLTAELASRLRLPAVVPGLEYVEAGGLMSYGVSYVAQNRRAATFVDKILKGAKPADLPVEQPTTFELAINMKTAKALGVKFPNSILVRATKVIE